MYLDKPMRDHTLLQTIARVNRPYEDEEKEMVKPHGFVLDFIVLQRIFYPPAIEANSFFLCER
jgi:type I site-specific restriction-modification system R (restriction) subunit